MDDESYNKSSLKRTLDECTDTMESQNQMLKEQSKMLHNNKKTTVSDIILSVSNQNVEMMKHVASAIENIATVAKAIKLVYDRQNTIDSKIWRNSKRLDRIEDMFGIK